MMTKQGDLKMTLGTIREKIKKRITPRMKWEKIIQNANENAGFEKYRIDAYGKIYKYKKGTYYYFCESFMYTNLCFATKKEFIDQEI